MHIVIRHCAAACLGLLTGPCLASAPTGLLVPTPPEKPRITALGAYDSPAVIELKFRSDDVTVLQSGHWRSRRAGVLAALEAYVPGARTGAVERVEPVFLLNPSERAAAARGQAQGPALHQWYRLHLRAGEDLVAVVNQLNALDAVEIAYPAPLPAAVTVPVTSPSSPAVAPRASPQLESRQISALPAAQGGIDAVHARTVAGGDGKGVRIADIEYSWNWRHEDLTKLAVPGTWIRQGSRIVDPFNSSHHGTSVLGQMVADANGMGVRGLASGATPHYVNVVSPETGYNAANAVLLASRQLAAGDVILIEQQYPGPAPCNQFVAPEWIPAIYDAISAATRRGIHVVQTAGNGGVNLDDTRCFRARFPRGLADSGSIIVGAGAPWPTTACRTGQAARSRLRFSTYGRRVNLQGVGQCVTSTGGGDLYNAGPNANYTGRFSGTSSSAPIVAAAVAALSGIAKAQGKTISPQAMRTLLVETGTAQAGNTGNIGPLPNLRAAIERLQRTP